MSKTNPTDLTAVEATLLAFGLHAVVAAFESLSDVMDPVRNARILAAAARARSSLDAAAGGSPWKQARKDTQKLRWEISGFLESGKGCLHPDLMKPVEDAKSSVDAAMHRSMMIGWEIDP